MPLLHRCSVCGCWFEKNNRVDIAIAIIAITITRLKLNITQNGIRIGTNDLIYTIMISITRLGNVLFSSESRI